MEREQIFFCKKGRLQMKEYDFSTVVRRETVGSGKWEEMLNTLGQVGPDVIPFSVADMELKNPPEVIEGLKRYLDENILGYSSPTDEYNQAVKSWMLRRHNWKIETDWILGTHGVVTAFFTAVNAFTQEGDSVLLLTPIYYPMTMAVTRNHRKVAEVPLLRTQDSYEIDFELLEEKASQQSTKMMILCSPHNPCSRVWTKEELEKIGDICLRHNVLVLSDEIHFDLIMPGYKHTVFASIKPEFAENCITCTAPSKTFNLAGLQTSNIIISNPAIRERFMQELQKYDGNPRCNILGLEACKIAYQECEEWLEQVIQLVDENRKHIEAFLQAELPCVKAIRMEGTYLMWLDFTQLGIECHNLGQILRQEAALFFDDGYIFGAGGEGYERWNLACPTPYIDAALLRLKNALKNYL